MPVNLNYKLFGSGDPVIILHGLLGSSRNWSHIARQLAQNYRVINVDLRNHGASEHGDCMTYEAMADDIDALIDRLCLRRTIIVGHSMGGKVAMTSALRNPGLFTALVVLDIAPVSYFFQFSGLIDAITAIDPVAVKSRKEMDRILAPVIPDTELRQFLLQNLLYKGHGFFWRVNLAAIRANMDNITGFPSGLENKIFPGPTLFLAGERSGYVTRDTEPVIHRYFPGAKIDYIEGAGHWLHADQPAAVLEKIRNFLAGPLHASHMNS